MGSRRGRGGDRSISDRIDERWADWQERRAGKRWVSLWESVDNRAVIRGACFQPRSVWLSNYFIGQDGSPLSRSGSDRRSLARREKTSPYPVAKDGSLSLSRSRSRVPHRSPGTLRGIRIETLFRAPPNHARAARSTSAARNTLGPTMCVRGVAFVAPEGSRKGEGYTPRRPFSHAQIQSSSLIRELYRRGCTRGGRE